MEPDFTAVALRKESVDRNRASTQSWPTTPNVALRKESVDRNYIIKITEITPTVALRKESVDRNTNFCPVSLYDLPSLSARRAWIEIRDLAEWIAFFSASLSARRAWIEMSTSYSVAK